ncbi:NrdH-redoxin [Micromonospora sp. CB01531]|nr:NrdH-redoxin [Micromonospora sp. CB01531]
MTAKNLSHHDALVVYGTGWCPDVRRSRALLDRAGIAYTYVDLDEDEAATELVRRLQRGRRRIPTLLWPDGSLLVEPTDDQLRAHLNSCGDIGTRR